MKIPLNVPLTIECNGNTAYKGSNAMSKFYFDECYNGYHHRPGDGDEEFELFIRPRTMTNSTNATNDSGYASNSQEEGQHFLSDQHG